MKTISLLSLLFLLLVTAKAQTADLILHNGIVWTVDSKSSTAEAVAIKDGKFVAIEDTVRSFKAVVDGEYDHLPEGAFYMVGGIEEAVAKAEKMAQDAS